MSILPSEPRPWKTLDRQLRLDLSPWLRVETHTVELPDGRILPEWAYVITPDYVLVLAITCQGKYVLLRQTKYAAPGITLACVGGYLEPGEDPLTAAQRELREETGYVAAEWQNLGAYVVDGNRGNGVAHLFVARQATEGQKAPSDDLEDQQLVLYTRAETLSALAAGEFKTLPYMSIMALALLGEASPAV